MPSKIPKIFEFKFHINDQSVLKYFLGIEVARFEDGICLNQRKYALELISEYGLSDAKHSPVLIEQNLNLIPILSHIDPFLTNPGNYERLIGRLIC